MPSGIAALGIFHDLAMGSLLRKTSLENALVVGGTKGIGKAIADALVDEGLKVRRTGRDALDLSRPVSAKAVRETLLEGWDSLSVLVLSAGRSAYLGPAQGLESEVKQMMQVNYFGRLAVFYACSRLLLKADRSVVLFITSSVTRHGAKGLGPYAASLAACEAFVRCERDHWRKHGVSLVALAPGWTETDQVKDLRPDYREAAQRWMPIGRFLKPEEVGKFALRIVRDPTWVGYSGRVEYLGHDLESC